MRLLKIRLFLVMLLVCSSLWAQTDSLAPAIPADSAKCTSCHSYTFKQSVTPVALIGGACLVRHFDKDVRHFRDKYVFDYHNGVDDVLQVSPGVLLLSLRAFGVEGKSESWGQLLAATGFSALMTAGVTEGMKNTWGRTRPYRLWFHNSFPSGHTFSAFTSATLLHREYGGKSPWFSIGGYTVASAVGISRILNRDHWASDVLAGAGFGLVSGNLGYGLAECMFANPRRGVPSYYNKKPSFLGVSAVVVPFGNDITGLQFAPDTQTPEKPYVSFNHKYGLGYAIEGAYFPFQYVGFGCETAMHYNYFRMDDGYFRSPENPLNIYYNSFQTDGKSTTYFFMPGVYAAVPLNSRVLLGGKFLFGLGETFSFNVDTQTPVEVFGASHWTYLYDWFSYGTALKTGVHTRVLVARYLELKAEVDYSHTSAGYTFYGFDQCSKGVSNLSFQLGAAIPLE